MRFDPGGVARLPLFLGTAAWIATVSNAATVRQFFDAPSAGTGSGALAFAFGGLETASLMGGEIQEPRRTIPRAILISGVIVTAIYMLGTLATLLALPAEDATGLQGIMQAIDRTAARIGFGGVTPAAAFMISLGSLGGVGAWLAACGRIPFVAGIDKALPAAFGRLQG